MVNSLSLNGNKGLINIGYFLEQINICMHMLGRIQNETLSIAIYFSSNWNYIDIKLANRLQLMEREVKRDLTQE